MLNSFNRCIPPYYLMFSIKTLKYCMLSCAVMLHMAGLCQYVTPDAGFEENKGQLIDQNGTPNDDVLYIFHGNGINLQLRKTGFSYDLFQIANSASAESELNPEEKYPAEWSKPSEISFHRIDVEFDGTSALPDLIPFQPLKAVNKYSNMPAGRPSAETRLFKEVLYKNVYPNIDLQFLIGANGQPKFNFIVNSGGHYEQIQLNYLGAPILVNDKKLLIDSRFGQLVEEIPYSYYKESENKEDKEFNYSVKGNKISYTTCGTIENNKTLIIDPLPSIAWSTYFGSTAGEIAYITKSDNSGNVFIAGRTGSATNIATAGAYQTTFGGITDAILVKYDASGVRLWSTYMGGIGSDIAYGLTLDSGGNAYVCGNSSSAAGISTAGTQQPVKGLNTDGFLMKFSPAGALIWGTYLGNAGDETAYSVVQHNDNEIYVCGETTSGVGFGTAGVVQALYGGGTKDAFISRYTAAGIRTWSTYYGGPSTDIFYAIDIHTDGRLVIGGTTQSNASIATPGSPQTSLNGTSDGMLVCLSSSGATRNWATYIGGSGTESITTVDIDPYMYIAFAGNTASATMLSTANAHQPAYGGVQDGFVGLIYLPYATVDWITYYGGIEVENLYTIITDLWGYIYLVGTTASLTGITTVDATQPSFGGGFNDGFIGIFGHVGYRQWGTYFGGNLNDAVLSIFPTPGPGAYICGATTSMSGIATAGSDQPVYGGGSFQDAFVAKLADLALPVEFESFELSKKGIQTVLCEWTTASEINNDHFEIERSTDNFNFAKVGTVNGAGNSFGLISYSFEDKPLNESWLYYRIKQVDTNGMYSYSDVKAIWMDSIGEVVAYPNPAKDEIRISIGQSTDVKIYSSNGQLMVHYTNTQRLAIFEADLSKYTPGLYHVVVNSESDTVQMSSFIKL